MNNDMYFLVRDLKKQIDPVKYYVDFLKKNEGSPKVIRDAIKVFRKYTDLKENPTFVSYSDREESLDTLKDILNSRYSIDKFPEYWI